MKITLFTLLFLASNTEQISIKTWSKDSDENDLFDPDEEQQQELADISPKQPQKQEVKQMVTEKKDDDKTSDQSKASTSMETAKVSEGEPIVAKEAATPIKVQASTVNTKEGTAIVDLENINNQ